MPDLRAVDSLINKINRTVSRVLLLPLIVFCLPLVVAIRLMRPWYLIRFGYFTVDRIGHWAFDLEYYLTETALNPNLSPTTIDFFFNKGIPCNRQLVLMSRRKIMVSSLVKACYQASVRIPFSEKHTIRPAREITGSNDPFGLFCKTDPQISFTEEENERGELFLHELGCYRTDKLVCLIVRDDAYLRQYKPTQSWEYHSYRDSDIVDYEETALRLAENGYWVFRMGKVVRDPLVVDHPRIVDYANRPFRSDFLDVWLISRSFFCVSTSTGLDSVALAFRKPLVTVNFLPLIDIRSSHNVIAAPKYLYWTKSGHYLNLREYLNHSYQSTQSYEKRGIGIRNLTPHDICNATFEMEKRLTDKELDVTESDEALHQLFWAESKKHPIFSRDHPSIHNRCGISFDFLRQHKEWFFPDFEDVGKPADIDA